jgi:probable HAF family extracellular repeat protein
MTMRHPIGWFVILTSLLCTNLPASADPGYRLVPLTPSGDTELGVYDLNRRGEVVGMRSIAGVTRAFRWRAGQFTDLHDTIDSASSYTQAVGINDLSAIVGVDYTNESFKGVLLRGSQVSPIAVVAGESQVFPLDINNRGQIIVDSYGGGQSGSFLVDGGNVQWLEGLPGEADALHAIAINERGVILGNTRLAAGTRAVLREDGALMNLGVVAGATASFAYDLNDRNQVVGIVSIGGGSQAMRWRDGTMELLPQLVPDPAASSAASINNWGVIVGTTIVLQPQYRGTATLWLGNHVVELDSLVRADDPLKPFVHLASTEEINDRGDIVVSGFDSRAPDTRTIYFMTLFDN